MRIGPIMVAAGVVLITFAVAYGSEDDGGEEKAGPSLRTRIVSLVQPSPVHAPPEKPEKPAPSPRCSGASPAPCAVFTEDTAADPDPLPFWGAVECDLDDDPRRPSGEHRVTRGGDPAPTATGRGQGNDAYREIVTHNGDEYFGERCELGRNDYLEEPNTVFYREGDHLLTFVSVLLPDDFPLETESTFQGVVQMKQTQPSDVGDEAPAIAMGAYQGRWQLFSSEALPGGGENDRVIWSTPAGTGAWTRFVFDVVYSTDPERGRLAVYLDLNGDGDFADEDERSPVFGDDEPIATLRPENGVASEGDALPPGSPVPSHLRVGLYHAPDIDCPARGCRVGIDNVQVARAAGGP